MPNARHGKACIRLGRFLDEFAEASDLGHVMSNDPFVEINSVPKSIRAPDFVFYSFDRLPKGEVPEELLPCQQNLAVEVKSPSNTWSELIEKTEEYFRSEVQVDIILDPSAKVAKIHRPSSPVETVNASESLAIPDLFPGFSLPLSKLF